MPQTYLAGKALMEVGKQLDEDHPVLAVTLPDNYLTYSEAVAPIVECLRDLTDDRVYLPITDPNRRERLRRLALESRFFLEGDVGSAPPGSVPPGSGSGSALPLGARPIRSRGLINQEECPQPASPERRAALKKMLNDENERLTPHPHILQLRAGTEGPLAVIVANVTLTAIDHDHGMPKCMLRQTLMHWDTGAEVTFITTDLLTPQFRSYLTDSIHEPYRNANGTQVQISLTLEFTNSIVKMEMIAIAVPKERIPNQRSGILLGQRACIDSLQYRSIPAAVLAAKGQTIDGSFWGDIILEGFVNSDGDYVEIH